MYSWRRSANHFEPATDGVMRLVFGHAGFFGYLKAGDGPVHWFNSYPAGGPEAGRDRASYVERLRALHRGDPPFIDRILSRVPGIDRKPVPVCPGDSGGRANLLE